MNLQVYMYNITRLTCLYTAIVIYCCFYALLNKDLHTDILYCFCYVMTVYVVSTVSVSTTDPWTFPFLDLIKDFSKYPGPVGILVFTLFLSGMRFQFH